jgi:flavin-dependent dehydrogenase
VSETEIRDLLIVGAGPAGLAAAIAAREAGLDYEVLEKGALVNSIFHFPRNQVIENGRFHGQAIVRMILSRRPPR